jgi:rhodanese-related sulfurtransferase
VRNIPDTDLIKAFVDECHPKSAIVVGGGFIGLEMAENLCHRGVETTIVEKLDQVMAPLDREMAAIIHAHLREKRVSLELETGVTSFSERGGRLVVTTDKGTELTGDMVILSVGVRPENKLAGEAGLEIGRRGGIVVKPTMQTSDPDIFAVGDAVEIRDFVTGRPTMTALAGPANKQGRIAADNAFGRRAIFRGTQGTVVVKIFDLTVAATGPSEKTLIRDDIPYLCSYTHSGSHASYYPGATMMAIKLLFSPGNGRVLGAQIVGKEGVDKRIDVLATAIRGNMTVFDLEELELAYAPPYSSAKDPINIAGFVATNILKGDLSIIHWSDLEKTDPETTVIIDLRQQEELDAAGSIPGARHIPMNDLREAMKDFDPSKNYITTCAVGLRGYLGYRILIRNGFNVVSMSGGYKTLLGAREEIMREAPQARVWLGE